MTLEKGLEKLKLKLVRAVKNYKKGFFSYVKNKQKQKENICPLLNRLHEFCHQQHRKAEVLNAFFTCLYRPWEQKCRLMQINPLWVMEEMVCELSRAWLLQINGPRGYPPNHVKRAGWCCCEAVLFEKLWRSGDIPEDWKMANVTPIYKKGLEEDPGNYRPVSLSEKSG